MAQANSVLCVNNLRSIFSGMMFYSNDYKGYVPSWQYQNSMEYTYPNGWKQAVSGGDWAPGSNIGSLVLLNYEGYVDSSSTTCSVFYPSVPEESGWGGGSWENAVYRQGGTYAFNDHLSMTISGATGTSMIPFTRVQRISQRFVYAEGSHQDCRVTESIDTGARPIWWGHDNSSNFLFGDGHVESFMLFDIPTVSGWPNAQPSPGEDTTYDSPW